MSACELQSLNERHQSLHSLPKRFRARLAAALSAKEATGHGNDADDIV